MTVRTVYRTATFVLRCLLVAGAFVRRDLLGWIWLAGLAHSIAEDLLSSDSMIGTKSRRAVVEVVGDYFWIVVGFWMIVGAIFWPLAILDRIFWTVFRIVRGRERAFDEATRFFRGIALRHGTSELVEGYDRGVEIAQEQADEPDETGGAS